MNSSTWRRLGLALLAAGCSTGPVTEPPLPPGDPGEPSAYYSEAELAVFTSRPKDPAHSTSGTPGALG